MNRQAMVIGLGQFGTSIARTLSERGVEVLAVDVRDERVRLASAFVAEAAAFDATDTEALARTSPERRDVCVCAIGDDSPLACQLPRHAQRNWMMKHRSCAKAVIEHGDFVAARDHFHRRLRAQERVPAHGSAVLD